MSNPLDAIKKMPTWGKVAVGVGGVGVAYLMWKRHAADAASSASSASSAGDSSATDPVTGLPYSQDNQTDPLTGMTYLAEAQEYGSVQAAEAAVSDGGYGSLGAGDEYDSYPVSGYYDDSGDTSGTTEAYSTNAQWAQAVEAGLSSIGYNPTDVSGAIGRYLSSLAVTSAQATIIYAAIGEYGQPPVGSYQVILQSPTSGTPPTGGTVRVPNVIGQSKNTAQAMIRQAGLQVRSSGIDKGTDKVSSQSPAAGTSVKSNSIVDIHVGPK